MKHLSGKISMLWFIELITLFSVIELYSAISTNKSESLLEFQYCLRKSNQPNLRECIGRSAISFLQRFDEKESVTLTEDFITTKDDKASSRSLVNFLDTDPVDIRGILENAGAVFSQRSFEWHMDRIYPGLMLKIGPSADANSVAQFVLDPTIDERNFNIDDGSTARILTKQYVVPFLLGLKFNLVALVPLLFTVICFLLKKSLFIAKLVIYISSILGIGGVAGALGSLGSWGGGFTAPIPPPHHAPGHHHHGAQFPGSFGFLPGKTTVFSHYFEDELQHTSPYKRQDRKVAFEKPRENVNNENSNNKNFNNMRPTIATTSATPAVDHFYDYERQVLMQDRSGKLRKGNGKLGPSAFSDDFAEDSGVINISSSHRFKTTSDNSGWNIVRV